MKILAPVIEKRQAVIYTPSGEFSDVLTYQMLRDAAEDGRPLVIHQLGDCDPAGRQMAVSVARTVQAMLVTDFPNLDVRMHAIGLTVEQADAWALPSTAFKPGEKRAEAWRAAFGRAQTELDAAVAKAPVQFAKMVDGALCAYFDKSLDRRVTEFRKAILTEANSRLAVQLGDDVLRNIREAAALKLGDLRDLVAEIEAHTAIDPDELGIELPPNPEPIVGEANGLPEPLFDSAGDYASNTARLRARKTY